MTADYFALLDLPPRFAVDLADLEARYHARSKLYHPDRHARADGPTRVRNALHTAELNQAYRTLREPLRRAEHLLARAGLKLDERSGTADPELLMEMMELREQLAEARATGDQRVIDSLAGEVRALCSEAEAELTAAFAAAEGGHVAALQQAGHSLVCLRYYHRFLDEIEVHEEQRLGLSP